jgi:hypothetical protein
MHVHGIGAKCLLPVNSSWKPRLDSKSTHALPTINRIPRTLLMHGCPGRPVTLYGANCESTRDLSVDHCTPFGYIRCYVGVTGRSFALQTNEYIQEQLHSCARCESPSSLRVWPRRTYGQSLGKENRSVVDCVSRGVVFPHQVKATPNYLGFLLPRRRAIGERVSGNNQASRTICATPDRSND